MAKNCRKRPHCNIAILGLWTLERMQGHRIALAGTLTQEALPLQRLCTHSQSTTTVDSELLAKT
jgi:hypothetical protein